jgi:hypothetical protein
MGPSMEPQHEHSNIKTGIPLSTTQHTQAIKNSPYVENKNSGGDIKKALKRPQHDAEVWYKSKQMRQRLLEGPPQVASIYALSPKNDHDKTR